ncbi:hypothetical protein CJD36_007955 [Flavipsychrobacter stenotrophus]|uniref:DUF3592 domain-containing protein n=1 Tax=Flavipsychrobacter stenotrophus TaxID=2077091 RepID=A0A2S7SXR2_9BACT|nr:hypothetical protein CJD36_007955 [Flavipsychrobacter stenotrophus]
MLLQSKCLKGLKMNPKTSRILFSLFLTVIVLGIIYFLYQRCQLLKNHKITIGKVIECRFLSKSGGSISLVYEYQVDAFNNIRSKTENLIPLNDCNEHFIGKTFPVIYNPENKSFASMLITPRDFKSSNIIFPDTLNWVNKYLRE